MGDIDFVWDEEKNVRTSKNMVFPSKKLLQCSMMKMLLYSMIPIIRKTKTDS